MSKRPVSLHRYIATDHELERLKTLAGFGELERHLEVDLEKLIHRWSDWHLPTGDGSRDLSALRQRAVEPEK